MRDMSFQQVGYQILVSKCFCGKRNAFHGEEGANRVYTRELIEKIKGSEEL